MKLNLNKSIYILIFIISLSIKINGQKFHHIPEQYINININEFMGVGGENIDTIGSIEISDFITYKEYKKYLKSISKDSTEEFYISQFPDPNISSDKKIYQEYLTNKKYEKFPVLGISWDNAMNFCKWKTLNDNEKKYIYRLPMHSEWMSALSFFNINKMDIEIDNKYSEWTLNTFDESLYNYSPKIFIDHLFNHKKTDPLALKRKKVVGTSYLYTIPPNKYGNYMYGYSTIGYRQVSFRIVKTKI